MRKFTKQEIENAKSYFENKGFEKVEINLGKRQFNYFVLPQSLNPNLPDFVVRLTGELNDGYVFGISESVLLEYRKYSVAHEFIEFNEIGINVKDRCKRALEEELNLVPKDIINGYVNMRVNFFRNLISYCLNQPEHYNEEDLSQFRENVLTLEKLIKLKKFS